MTENRPLSPHLSIHKRILPRHFYFIKNHALKNNISADFWLVKDTYHVDAMLKYPDEYGSRMKKFFEKHLSN